MFPKKTSCFSFSTQAAATVASDDETRATGGAHAPGPSANNHTATHTPSAGPSTSAAALASRALHEFLETHMTELRNDDVLKGANAFNTQLAMRLKILDTRAGEKRKR